MEIERKNRPRLPGFLALLLQCVMLTVLVLAINGNNSPAKVLAGTIALVAGNGSSGANEIFLTVDSQGQVGYGSKTLKVREVSPALYRDISSPAAVAVTIRAPGNADAAVVARLMHEVRRVGVKQVRLRIAK